MINIFPLHHDIYLISKFLCLNPYITCPAWTYFKNLPGSTSLWWSDGELQLMFQHLKPTTPDVTPWSLWPPMAAYGLTGTQCGPLSPHVQQLLGPSRRGSTCGTILGSKAMTGGTPIARWFIMDSATKKLMIWVVSSFQEISASDNRITILGKDGIPTTYGYIYIYMMCLKMSRNQI